MVGDKPKPKSTTSNASDLSNNIKADLPFFAKMLDLSAEQQVKLGLYLEFANTGSLGRLKDMYVHLSLTSRRLAYRN